MNKLIEICATKLAEVADRCRQHGMMANIEIKPTTGTGPLTVDIRAARFAGIDFSGSVAQTRAGPFAGTLRANGSGFDGTVRLAAQGNVQRADVLARASNARIPADPPITIQSGIIRATALLLPAGPSITGDARLINVRRDTLVIANSQARIRYANGRGQVALVRRDAVRPVVHAQHRQLRVRLLQTLHPDRRRRQSRHPSALPSRSTRSPAARSMASARRRRSLLVHPSG